MLQRRKKEENKNYENLIFHNNQVQQYSYQERFQEKKISRKGNSLDNELVECFFGLLKPEIFYDQEEKIKRISFCFLQKLILISKLNLSHFLGQYSIQFYFL